MSLTLASRIMRFRRLHPNLPIGPIVRFAAKRMGRKGAQVARTNSRRNGAQAWATRYRWWLDLGCNPEQAGYLAGRGL